MSLSTPSKKRFEVLKSRLLLVEGMDAFSFWIWACEAFTQNEVQVYDFGGNQELQQRLLTITRTPNFDSVTSLAIIRDAETDPDAAIQSVQSALRYADLPVPDAPFAFAEGTPRTVFLLQPGFSTDAAGSRAYLPGTLEDLCLMTVAGDPCLDCVANYMDCLTAAGEPMPRPHKTRLHGLLAGKDIYVGLKVGEAARVGAWDWNHAAFAGYRELIAVM